MTFQPGASVYTQGFGTRPEGVEVPHIEVRNPSPTDVNYPIGKRWLNTASEQEFILYSFSVSSGVTLANWDSPVGPTGAVISLSNPAGTKVFPDASGNIQLANTASQIVINSNPSSHNLQLSLANPTILPNINVTSQITALNAQITGNLQVQGRFTASGRTDYTGSSYTGTSPITLLGVENTLYCQSTTGAMTFIIPVATFLPDASQLLFIDATGTAGTNNITIQIGSPEMIVTNGGAPTSSFIMNSNYQSVLLRYCTSGASKIWIVVNS